MRVLGIDPGYAIVGWGAAPVQRVELPALPLPAQQPAQAVTQPQTPVQQPVSPAQGATEAPAKPLTAMQIFQIVWAGGSALLGLWLFGTWLVFMVQLHKSRRFLGRHGRTRIYISSTVKSPCLAGLVPACFKCYIFEYIRASRISKCKFFYFKRVTLYTVIRIFIILMLHKRFNSIP